MNSAFGIFVSDSTAQADIRLHLTREMEAKLEMSTWKKDLFGLSEDEEKDHVTGGSRSVFGWAVLELAVGRHKPRARKSEPFTNFLFFSCCYKCVGFSEIDPE